MSIDMTLFYQATASLGYVGAIGALVGIAAKRWIDRG